MNTITSEDCNSKICQHSEVNSDMVKKDYISTCKIFMAPPHTIHEGCHHVFQANRHIKQSPGMPHTNTTWKYLQYESFAWIFMYQNYWWSQPFQNAPNYCQLFPFIQLEIYLLATRLKHKRLCLQVSRRQLASFHQRYGSSQKTILEESFAYSPPFLH